MFLNAFVTYGCIERIELKNRLSFAIQRKKIIIQYFTEAIFSGPTHVLFRKVHRR